MARFPEFLIYWCISRALTIIHQGPANMQSEYKQRESTFAIRIFQLKIGGS